jgi:hypothetical protein
MIPDIETFLPVAIFKMAATIPQKINIDGTPSESIRTMLLLIILMTSGDSDKQKQE